MLRVAMGVGVGVAMGLGVGCVRTCGWHANLIQNFRYWQIDSDFIGSCHRELRGSPWLRAARQISLQPGLIHFVDASSSFLCKSVCACGIKVKHMYTNMYTYKTVGGGGGGSDAHRRALLGAIINSSLTYNYGHPETTGNRFSLIVQVVSLLLLFGFSAASPSATFIMPSSSLSLSQLSSIRLPSVCVRVCFGSLGITHVNLITRRPCENQCAGSFGSISCQGTLITWKLRFLLSIR